MSDLDTEPPDICVEEGPEEEEEEGEEEGEEEEQYLHRLASHPDPVTAANLLCERLEETTGRIDPGMLFLPDVCVESAWGGLRELAALTARLLDPTPRVIVCKATCEAVLGSKATTLRGHTVLKITKFLDFQSALVSERAMKEKEVVIDKSNGKVSNSKTATVNKALAKRPDSGLNSSLRGCEVAPAQCGEIAGDFFKQQSGVRNPEKDGDKQPDTKKPNRQHRKKKQGTQAPQGATANPT